ncbi:unnamed protein product [Caenorhabditis bovis]|uniref:sarcosine oxidasee (formaldehyde-forming) n=1 Tax=Caenorhabditis bovis TaxID=2654633 RepID=A0A8S1EER7_9PELO|nr:unnamed protein product [Caenorhabditis bovis]
MENMYDVVVVGAGIFGSCTAFHCQKLGLKTLLLEQYTVGHKNGSSHGMTRIIRYAHTEKEYLPLVSDSYIQTFEMEELRNERLWKKTGLLWVSKGEEIDKISENLRAFKVEHEIFNGFQINRKYTQFKFGQEWKGLLDPMGGVIFADKWLQAYQAEFKQLGGVLQDNEEVTEYKENDETGVCVYTNRGTYTAKKVIFTVGAWIGKLLPELKFKPEPISIAVCFWEPKDKKDEKMFSDDHLPVFIAQDNDLQQFHFGLPGNDHPGTFKFCYHTGPTLDANLNHPASPSEECIKLPAKFIENHIPLVNPIPKIVETCKYTVSPDHHYIIGPISEDRPNVIVGGCGSGSGFKVAPAIGRVLAELAADQDPSIEIAFFSPDRFI